MPQCNFTGRRKALLIGINYFDTPYELKGCINDVRNIKDFLMETYSFPSEGIVVMTDDQSDNPLRMPTRRNILDAMNWLADGARPNDSLFFHFSGHGSQIPDLDGDEEDGYDETICPCDFTKEGMIVDDEMNRILVRPLPAGCRLTALFDCCHSGTALDLPYIYNSQGELKFFQPAQAVVSTLYDLRAKTQKGDLAGAGKTTEINNQRDKGLSDLIRCDPKEWNVGDSGAMSLALITALRTNPRGLTYLDLLNSVRQVLQKVISHRSLNSPVPVLWI
ncbi:Ca(2+)-dependent cysteine protease [Massospora cicadina]|nr:Ca(2+)-dependent cysteine protease [Massospora cicadina]